MKMFEFILISVVVSMALIFDIRLQAQFALPKLVVLTLGVTSLALCWLEDYYQKKPLPRAILYPLLAFGGWLIVSTVFAVHSYTALHGVYGWYHGLTTFGLYLLLFAMIATSRIDTERVLKALTLAMSIVSLYAIIQSAGIDFIDFPKGRPTSTIGNAVIMAASLLLAFPFAVYFYFKNKNILWIVSAIVILTGIILSQSRGVQAALILVAIAVLGHYIYKRLTKRGLLYSLIGFLAGIILIFSLLFTFASQETVKRYTLQDEGMSRRILYWDICLQMLMHHPITGVGLDNISVVYPLYRTPEVSQKEQDIMPTVAHNGYLHLAVTGGIPLLLFYLWLIFSSLKHINTDDSRLKIAFIASIAGYLIQDITGWMQLGLTPFFWIILGLGVAGRHEIYSAYEAMKARGFRQCGK